jgi:hypothetical protein
MALTLPIEKTQYVRAGDQFSFSFVISDKSGYTTTVRDLTGYTAAGQIRRYPEQSSELMATMTFASTAGDLTDGKIVTTIASATTALLIPDTYYYDIYIDDGNDYVKTYYYGKFVVMPRITV